MRGRMANVASSCSGRPCFWMTIVTSAASHCWRAVTLQPETVDTLLTVPTFTPAIRTNEFGRRPLALEKIACTV